MAIALLVCLAPMPYGYYMLIRFAATALFGIMAYEFFQDRQKGLYIICLTLALLFQPIIKIALGRVIWNIVDVVVALFLVYLFLRKKKADSYLGDYRHKGETGSESIICAPGSFIISPISGSPSG